MALYLVWLLCVIIAITEVQGKSVSMNGLGQGLIMKRCGANKYDDILNLIRVRRAAVVDRHWNQSIITYMVMDGPHTLYNRPASLTKERAEELVAKAFAEWAPYCGLHFKEWQPGDGRRPDIMLSFESRSHGDGQSFDGPGGTLAHADYPYEEGSDVHFDDDEIWVDRKTSTAEEEDNISSFYPIALHEIGHALGLRHNDDKHSIMYGYENSYVQSLSKNDKTNMQKLYGITEDFAKPVSTPEEVPTLPSSNTSNNNTYNDITTTNEASTTQPSTYDLYDVMTEEPRTTSYNYVTSTTDVNTEATTAEGNTAYNRTATETFGVPLLVPSADLSTTTSTANPSTDASTERSTANPSSDASTERSTANPSTDASTERSTANPSTDASTERSTANPSTDASTERSTANPSTDASTERSTANPSTDASTERSTANPSTDASTERSTANPSTDASTERSTANPSTDASTERSTANISTEASTTSTTSQPSTYDVTSTTETNTTYIVRPTTVANATYNENTPTTKATTTTHSTSQFSSYEVTTTSAAEYTTKYKQPTTIAPTTNLESLQLFYSSLHRGIHPYAFHRHRQLPRHHIYRQTTNY